MSSNQKLADSFHASGSASLCPPNNSAHISAHNSIRTVDSDPFVNAHATARQKEKLDEAYKKACKRAEKNGRTLPSRDEYYDYNHWGYPYYSKEARFLTMKYITHIHLYMYTYIYLLRVS